jgi:ABC-type lipoprotein export system ATPase subunit
MISQQEANKRPEIVGKLQPDDMLSVPFKSIAPCLPQRESPFRAEGRPLAASEVTKPGTAPQSNDRMGTEEVVRIEDISKTYRAGEVDVPVLKGVSLTIRRGELVALMGASGSGKSTLMNILGCLDRPSSGRYWFEGQDISTLSADARADLRSKKLGFVFQSFNLLPRTSALENVQLPLECAQEVPPDDELRERARAVLKRVGLEDRMDHHPGQLSGGQQQRVAIARALVNRPVLLLADEPTGNLDSRTSAEILRMFQELNAEGLTIVLVTHDPEVAAHAERIIRIRDGRIEDSALKSPKAAVESALGCPVSPTSIPQAEGRK